MQSIGAKIYQTMQEIAKDSKNITKEYKTMQEIAAKYHRT